MPTGDPFGVLPRSQPIIVVADDDAANRTLVAIILRRAGYRVIEAADGVGALAAIDAAGLDAAAPDLFLLDVRMPRADGLAVTRRLRADPATATTPIILLTGLDDTADKVAGLDAGATDFITKPYDTAEFLARVRAALRTKAAFDRLEDAQSVLVALANAVEAKDPATEHHCNRLAGLALGLGRLAEFDDRTLEAVGYGAVLHDVGKIGIPEALLAKRGPLEPAEWTVMREHAAIGESIVAPLRLGAAVAPIVRGHHERWDGRGYPDGLAGDRIPVGARIVAIVDAFDAMVHDRPYRSARSADEARDELRAERGRQFDPELAALFVDHAEDLGALDDLVLPERTHGLSLVAVGS